MKRELSVFIDESGDFGRYDNQSPYYIVAFVFHEQERSIDENVKILTQKVSDLGFPPHAIHTGPLIRRESLYENYTVDERKRLFGCLFNFVRRLPVRYETVIVEKSQCNDSVELTNQLSKNVAKIVSESLEYFMSFDSVIVYYDNGQIELTKILTSVFNALLSKVEFRKVAPADYRLFQAADLVCTLELLQTKIEHGGALTTSEKQFLSNKRDFKKNFYKHILKKQHLFET